MNINFKRILNWDIKSVSQPKPIIDTLKGEQQPIGYEVTVDYVYHGSKSFFFDADSERSWIMYGGPKEEANKFYHEMLQKQKQQQNGKKITTFMRQR